MNCLTHAVVWGGLYRKNLMMPVSLFSFFFLFIWAKLMVDACCLIGGGCLMLDAG